MSREQWLRESKPWLAEQIAAFNALAGVEVTQWRAEEMALDEDPVVWHHPSVPMLQLSLLGGVFSGAERVIRSVQGFDGCGLVFLSLDASNNWLNPPGTPDSQRLSPTEHRALDSIFRARHLVELPLGSISNVTVSVENGLVASVAFTVAGRRVSLVAGEVHAQFDGTFTIGILDESLLVQVDGMHPSQTMI